MKKAIVFDSSLCNGCYNCQLACKDENVDNTWEPYSVAQPDLGQFWCGIEETVHGQTPKVRVEYKFMMHSHSDKLLEEAGDIAYRTEDGFVIIDPDKAAGISGPDAWPREKICDNTPGGVYWNEELGIPQSCTGCQHLVDQGELPHCVDHCPTGALAFGDEADMDLTNCVPAEEGGVLWYKNLPGLFIAGEVWDPEPNEIIENAKVTLHDAKGFQVAETLTDGFGDFWFRKLEPGDYVVTIKADGFETVKKDVKLEKSLNIGDFAMKPKVEEDGE